MKNKKIIILIVVAVACLGGLFIYKGLFSEKKIDPGEFLQEASTVPAPKQMDQALIETITEWYEAVGTIRPRTETRIESLATAKVKAVAVTPGNSVTRGQLLISLDDRQLTAKLDQAKQALLNASAGKRQADQAVIAAQAGFAQAESAYQRTKTYYESQAATSQDMEKAESGYLQAKAGLSRAKEALAGAEAGIRQAEEVVKEAEIALGYTQITAPEAGEVLKRFVEPGDLALPGKPLMILQTSGMLRLEAYVREGLITKVTPGATLNVKIDSLDHTIQATVEEIVPYADPQTRTFLVKVAIPSVTGLYPGMFGKLLIPARTRQVVLVPQQAVRRIGQLELLTVKQADTWKTRFVKTGEIFGDKIEILSGLAGNETIGMEG
jgi:HlyD family secretion protein